MQQFIPASTKVELRTTPGDPIQVQMHTLANGLRLFLSVNNEEPRVHTEIAVRVGSKHDPADTTGLAHYFEHMMFKGTDRLGSLDWVKEKAILDEIELLFEAFARNLRSQSVGTDEFCKRNEALLMQIITRWQGDVTPLVDAILPYGHWGSRRYDGANAVLF